MTTRAASVRGYDETKTEIDCAYKVRVGENVLFTIGSGAEPRGGRVLSETEEMGVECGIGFLEHVSVE